LSGDGGYKDEDGYIFITGRTDDVINVGDIDCQRLKWKKLLPTVAECAVIGIQDE
jgi:propionyl-CoA synthetase